MRTSGDALRCKKIRHRRHYNGPKASTNPAKLAANHAQALDLAGKLRYIRLTCTRIQQKQDEFIYISILWNEARFDDYKQ
jgi:hypothetical protein